MYPPVKPIAWAGALVLALCAPLQAQTVFTEIAGFTTLAATSAPSASEPSFNFINHSLARQRKSLGTVTAGGTDTITDGAASWSTTDFSGVNGPHYVLITSGSLEGNTYNIVSNTSDTLTLEPGSGDFSSVVGDTFRVYAHNSLGSIFGADPTANGVEGGFGAASADQVLLHDPVAGSFITYFYKDEDDFFDPNDVIGWVNASDVTVEVSDTIIPPNRGFIYVRRPTSPLSLKIPGYVIQSTITVSIVPGFNLVDVPYPADANITLGTSGLAPENPEDPEDLNVHLQGGFGAASAEPIYIWDGSGYQTYFFKNEDDFFDPNDVLGWVNAANVNESAADTSLQPGSFFIARKSGNPPLDWVFPTITP